MCRGVGVEGWGVGGGGSVGNGRSTRTKGQEEPNVIVDTFLSQIPKNVE